jgi:carbon monoxide dehydrogenase subunit G
MIIESTKVIVNQPVESIFTFLKDSNNILHLLPQDKISDWKSDETSCSFKVQGGIIIPLEQVSLEEPSKIFLKSGPKAPFKFDLTIFLIEKGNETEGYLKFDGEVNAFLKIMIENPLRNLFNSMSEKLKEYYAS